MALKDRSDIGFLSKMVDGEVPPEELEKISDLFLKEGGSWETIFKDGLPSEISKLKSLLKEQVHAKKKPTRPKR